MDTKMRRPVLLAGMPPKTDMTRVRKSRLSRSPGGLRQDNVLAADAERLKRAYTFERRLYESSRSQAPSRYTPSSRFDGRTPQGIEDPGTENAWLKLVKGIRKLGVEDPAEYIRLLFSELGLRDDAVPQPSQLLAPRYSDLYRNAKHISPAGLVEDRQNQQRLVRSRMFSCMAVRKCSLEEALGEVLMDPTLDLSPLFRVTMSLSMKQHEGMTNETFSRFFRPVVSQYKKRAFVQYARNPEAYQESWAEWLDKKFVRHAVSYYDRQMAAV